MKTKAGQESGFKSREDLYNYFKEDGLSIMQSYWNEKDRLVTEYGHDWNEFEIMMKVTMVNPADATDILPIPLSMRLDAINRKHTKIGDFKTSGSKYDEAETRKKIQGQCYGFGWLMKHNVFIPEFDYVVLRKGLKRPDRIQVVPLKYDMADMQAFYFRVKNILLQIANKEFDRPLKGHAPYCRCKEYEERLNVKDIIIKK
jgi:hypothetical protein